MTKEETHFQFYQYLESFNLVYIKLEIFLCLDYQSLHKARQVCKDWNDFIKKEIWSSRPSHTRRLLSKCWRQTDEDPRNRVIECPSDLGFYLAVNDKIMGLGTKNYKTLVMDPGSGDSLGTLEMNSVSAVVDELIPDPNVHDEEAHDVQLDVTDQVIVTVAGSGLVAVWDRSSLRLLYSACPHGLDNVLGVRVVGDFMVTGGSHGSIAAFSIISVASHSTPVVKEECNMTRVHRAISHMDSDGTRVLVGTERELVLWDFSERAAPNIQSRVRSGQVCCCVMSFPHAFCTGLFLNYGVQVWDMEKQEKIRHIHTDLSMWVLTIKNNILATSMSVLRDEEMEEDSLASPSIFIHDIPELVNPGVKTEKVWAKELKCPIEHFSDPHIALNTTSLFAVTRNAEEGSKIHVWDFWNY